MNIERKRCSWKSMIKEKIGKGARKSSRTFAPSTGSGKKIAAATIAIVRAMSHITPMALAA